MLGALLMCGCLERECWRENPVSDENRRLWERWEGDETACNSNEDCAMNPGAPFCYDLYRTPEGEIDPESPWRMADGSPAAGVCGCAFPQIGCNPWGPPLCFGEGTRHLSDQGDPPICIECTSDSDCAGVFVGLYEERDQEAARIGEVPLAHCDEAEGRCVECLTDDQCSPGTTCNPDYLRCQSTAPIREPMALCRFCADSSACPAGMTCVELGSSDPVYSGSYCLALPHYIEGEPICTPGFVPTNQPTPDTSGSFQTVCVPHPSGDVTNGPVSCEARQYFLAREPCVLDDECGLGGLCRRDRCTMPCTRTEDCMGVGACDPDEYYCRF